jgi:hypothetical protein
MWYAFESVEAGGIESKYPEPSSVPSMMPGDVVLAELHMTCRGDRTSYEEDAVVVNDCVGDVPG